MGSVIDGGVLHHLGFSTNQYDFKEKFGKTKVVVTCGSQTRISKLAQRVAAKFGVDDNIPNLAAEGERYAMYQVGPVLFANHGMGVPSTLILLNELIALTRSAGCGDVVFIRMGTCVGLGIEPGTIVITEEALNGGLEPFYEQYILGKLVRRQSVLEQSLVQEFVHLAKTSELTCPILTGKTICFNDFYEETLWNSGAVCELGHQEKLDFMRKAFEMGVRNMEMESLAFASLCHRAGIPAAVICVALIDRLQGEQTNLSAENLRTMEFLPSDLIIAFIEKRWQ